MINLYERYCLPRLLDFACGGKPIQKQREKVVPMASGVVLEVGMGSGQNLPFYALDQIELIYGLEPSAGMRALAAPVIKASGLPVELIELPGEEIPLPDDTVDTVLLTYTLCTIADRAGALQQMKRVLKPSGRLIFCEHARAPDESVIKWQDRLNPIWRPIAGGCCMNVDILGHITAAGFHIVEQSNMYLPSTPKVLGYNVWGVATQ